jgi:hypothetical protein
MTMKLRLTWLALACSFVAFGAAAQGLHAVKPLTGWACMKLNLSEKQSLDPSVHVPVRDTPDANAPAAGWAAMTVAVRSPTHDVNGFQEMLFPNGKHVWIASKDLTQWSSLADPTARCVPSMLSNGKPGFAYPH